MTYSIAYMMQQYSQNSIWKVVFGKFKLKKKIDIRQHLQLGPRCGLMQQGSRVANWCYVKSNFEMRFKTKLEITELKWAEEMNKNLLWFELINLIQGFEALGDGVQGDLRKGGGGVGWMITRFCPMFFSMILPDVWFCVFRWCLIQRYGVSIYRIQHGLKCAQVDGKDWIMCW